MSSESDSRRPAADGRPSPALAAPAGGTPPAVGIPAAVAVPADGAAPAPPAGGAPPAGAGRGRRSIAERLRGIEPALLAPLLTAFPVGVSIAFGIILVSLNFEGAGESAATTGVAAASPLVGVFLAIPLLPRLSRRFGARALTLWGLAMICLCSVAMAVRFEPLSWILLRFAIGAMAVPVWVFSEAWVVSRAPPESRGFWVGAYGGLMAAGYAVGPALIALLGSDPILILIPAGLAALDFAIFFALRRGIPDLPMESSPLSPRLLLAMPALATAALVAGIAEESPIGLLPVWGLRLGMSETAISLLIFVFALGSALGQLPAGRLADRFGPERCLAGSALLTAAVPLSLAAAPPLPWWGMSAAFLVWGVGAFALYTHALAAMGRDFERRSGVASANALFIMVFSLGVMVGPPVAGGLMEAHGPDALLWSVGLAPLLIPLALALPRRPL